MPLARILTGSSHALLGVEQAAPVFTNLRNVVPLLAADALLIRVNGAAEVLAGTRRALQKLPRLSALVLLVSPVLTAPPGTVSGRSMTRPSGRVQFHKHLAMIGGLLFPVLDRPRHHPLVQDLMPGAD